MISGASPLSRRGATNYSNAALAGNVVVVSAGANVSGIVVRTVAANTSGNLLIVRAGGATLMLLGDTQRNYLGPGIVIPPGIALEVSISVGSVDMAMTYDLL